MKTKLLAALLSASLIGGGAYAATQDAPPLPPPGGPMMLADADKDGVITRAEALAGAEAMFARADANKDGKLIAEERKAMQPRGPRHGGPGRHGPGGPGEHFGKRGDRQAMLLERFDADHDGKLSDAERAAAKQARQAMHAQILAKFDADKDGKLSPAERDTARAAFPRRGAMGPSSADAPDAE